MKAWRRNGRFWSTLAIACFAMVLCIPGTAEASGEPESGRRQFLTIASAGTGGAFYPIAGAMADIISTNLAEIEASAQVTGGAVENVQLVGNRDNELGITSSAIAFAGLNGTRPFDRSYTELRTLFSGLMVSAMQIVIPSNSNIRSIADLRGARIGVGPAGGGGLTFLTDLFALEGFTLQDVRASYTSYSDAISDLRDGNLDAVAVASAVPAPVIQELTAGNRNFRILDIDSRTIDRLQEQNPYYIAVHIPAAAYGTAMDQTTIGIPNIVVVHNSLDEDLVYRITKALFENVDAIHAAHPAARGLSLEVAESNIVVPLHAGALRYFNEQR